MSLILLLALPLNAGAASWMAMSMADTDQAIKSLDTSMSPHHEHHSMSSDHIQSMDVAAEHEHDSGDCDEHCMSCSSHCSGSGIASSGADFQNLGNPLASTVTGFKLTREYLLLRPPIHA